MNRDSFKVDGGSFRDRGGFVFKYKNDIYRQINHSAKDDFDFLISSGLCRYLQENKMLVEHEEIELGGGGYKTIKPKKIDFISYPYEWSFSQIKDAALLTLEIQQIALEHGMSLKDASAYNIQFQAGRPIFIDTLSFEKIKENSPWVAYRQFCQHFLAPLLLISGVDIRLSSLMSSYIDGIPLDMASSILPFSKKIKPSVFIHIYLHAKSQKAFSQKKISSQRKFSLTSQKAILDSLKTLILKTQLKKDKTEWGEYYTFTNYKEESFKEKKDLVSSFIDQTSPKRVLDLGANDGTFSRLSSEKGIFTVSSDIDLVAVEKNYLNLKEKKEKNILPLFLDLFNPNPSIGWGNEERKSFLERANFDLIISLALIHHLSITNHLPFSKIADLFSRKSRFLIIEFVPIGDSNADKLVQNRGDDLSWYNEDNFIKEFSKHYTVVKKAKINNTKRTLYLMKSNE
ncbi:SAM-dependent methyltransferase [Candidatus Parcubacteria bacterium]|nr:MAG: SAM-dependent methyltransferase [Candidatus Parcubacteria bacterium]